MKAICIVIVEVDGLDVSKGNSIHERVGVLSGG